MPANDSYSSGTLLRTVNNSSLAVWRANEEGYVVGSEMMKEPKHQLAIEFLREKNFAPDELFDHGRDCYYKINHCHIEDRRGARFIRPSQCSKFMLRSGSAIIKEQLQPGNPKQKWLPTYHGTHPSNVASILRHGLLPSGSAIANSSTTVECANGNAYGNGVYTTIMPLYAQLYAQPEIWRGMYVQTFFMLCQHPDTIDRDGEHGRATRNMIGRGDIYKLYEPHVCEAETQYMTRDPSHFCMCALLVKIHDQDPTAPGGEFHKVASLLKELDKTQPTKATTAKR